MYAHVPAESDAFPPVSGWTQTEVSVSLRRGVGGKVRVEGVLCSAPVWFHWDGGTLWVVGSGASPAGEDHIRVRVEVGVGVAVAVRSVAATVIYAARGAGTRWDTEIHVADGALLDWRTEPVILTERARHEANTTVHVAAGADVTLDDILLLGRAQEALGSLRSTLAVWIDNAPVSLTSIDTSLPGWSGPAGVNGMSIVASRLRLQNIATTAVADDTRRVSAVRGATLLRPATGCRLAVATGTDVIDARRSLDMVLPD